MPRKTSDNSEEPVKPRKSLKEWTRNICKRFWWLFLLAFTALVLVIVLPLVLVAYPKAARNAVRDSTLNITSMAILDPSPDSIELTVVEKLYTDSSYHPTLYPFTASLYLPGSQPDQPFVSIQIPKVKARNNATVTVGPQRVNITNMEQFTKYVLTTAASSEFTYSLRGKGDLKEGGLPRIQVDYDKNITMRGLNGLQGFSLLSFSVLNETEADGTNAIGTLSIPNPTVMTIALGNVTLALSVNGTSIGTATLPDLVLNPGANTQQMRAEVYQLVVAAMVMERENATLPVDIRGNTSTFGGQQIPYYNTMLAATQFRIDLDVADAMEGGN